MNKRKQILEEDAAKTYNQFKVFEGKKYTDRKSTRLNSSHLGISYAVFCLKKKITKEQIDWNSRNARNIKKPTPPTYSHQELEHRERKTRRILGTSARASTHPACMPVVPAT